MAHKVDCGPLESNTKNMEKDKIIEQLRELGVQFNPNSQLKTLQALLDEQSNTKTEIDGVKSSPETPPKEDNQVLEMLKQVTGMLEGIQERVNKLEGKDVPNHKAGATQKDVESASEMNKDLDPRILRIVEETLGIDFGVKLTPFEDRPGFLFSIVVPKRLSDNKQDSRPITDPMTGQYKKDKEGNVLHEFYYPEDKRSRAIGSIQSYDAIKEHCERVRSHIVAYYQKMSKPLPEFKIK